MSTFKAQIQLIGKDESGKIQKLAEGTHNIQVTVDELGAIVDSSVDFLVVASGATSVKQKKH